MESGVELKLDDKAILILRGRIQAGKKKLLQSLGKILYTEVKDITNQNIYSNYQLKKLNYPYSTKHVKNFGGIDDRLISKRTGKLWRSIRRTTVIKGPNATIVTWVGDPKAKYLLKGTDKMRKRNFLELAMERTKEKANKEQKRFLEELEK